MKKYLLILFILIISTSTILCSKEKLEYNFVSGQIYYQKMVINTTIMQYINDEISNVNMLMTMSIRYKILDLKDSIYNTEVRYTNMTMKTTTPYGKVESNSDRTDGIDIGSTIFHSMMDKPFTLKIKKNGDILEVLNMDTLFSGMFDNLYQLTDEQKEAFKKTFMESIGGNKFKENFELGGAFFPDFTVVKGDKWQVTKHIDYSIPLDVNYTYELKDITDSLYIISMSSTLKTSKTDKKTKVGKYAYQYDLKGDNASEIKIDKKSGWIFESRGNQLLKGTMETFTNNNSDDTPPTKTPISINYEITITDK